MDRPVSAFFDRHYAATHFDYFAEAGHAQGHTFRSQHTWLLRHVSLATIRGRGGHYTVECTLGLLPEEGRTCCCRRDYCRCQEQLKGPFDIMEY